MFKLTQSNLTSVDLNWKIVKLQVLNICFVQHILGVFISRLCASFIHWKKKLKMKTIYFSIFYKNPLSSPLDGIGQRSIKHV